MKLLASSFGSLIESKAAVITFSHDAELSIKYNDYLTLDNFKRAVDGLPLFGYTTRIDLALKLARAQFLSSKNGARRNVPKLIILVTDGSQTKATDAVDPMEIARELRQAGFKLIVVGIGTGIKIGELAKIAGNASNVFLANNFDALQSPSFVQHLSKKACDSGMF